MKIRYSAFVLCILTAHCFSMDSYSEETTLLLKQEFEKHIVTQALPDLLTIRSFLQNNANPNILITVSVFNNFTRSKKTETYTPLILACLHESTARTCLLLQHGADPNLYIPHAVHYSPLAAACTNKNFSVVQLLLDHHADVNYAPLHKLTPLILACKNSKTDNIAKHLIQKGANVHATRINPHLPGENALYYADACGNKKLMALLLNHGAVIALTMNKKWISQETCDFMLLRPSVQENLSLAFFYDTTKETQGLCAYVPKDVALIILDYYHQLKIAEMRQKWENICYSLYLESEKCKKLLRCLPFMTIKEQQNICCAYYMKQLDLFSGYQEQLKKIGFS